MTTTALTIDTRRALERLEELGITYQELGDRLGITRAGASNLVNGHARASLERATRLASALECSVGELVLEGPAGVAYAAGAGRRASGLWTERTAITQALGALERVQALLRGTGATREHPRALPALSAAIRAHEATTALQAAVLELEAELLEAEVDGVTLDR